MTKPVGYGAISRWSVGFRASTQPTITHDKTSRVRSHIPLVCWVSCLNPTYDYPRQNQSGKGWTSLSFPPLRTGLDSFLRLKPYFKPFNLGFECACL
ncbi:hypothetical protein FIV49_15605 [Cylindrospermopsis raciborskii GIHE 2018]|nr:hypothetical protein FIV49_15605 [Cylindrospermopsis raciborskii GIHE 2018]